MKELSLNVLDIVENSAKAGATLIEILLTGQDDLLTLQIIDNGCGMSPEMVKRVSDPFCTTRTTRKVGMGIPLLKLAAEQTGGSVGIFSKQKETFPNDHGTTVTAIFHPKHIDAPPLGDMVSTVVTVIQGHPEIDFLFIHKANGKTLAEIDTRQMRQILGDVPLSSPEVLTWTAENLKEQYRDSGCGGSVYI